MKLCVSVIGVGMESIYLKSLVEVLKVGSFSKAAENLCVTQSAVSRRIKFLEDRFGLPLVDRSGPVLVPTEAGTIVLEKAMRMLDLEHELLKDLKGVRKQSGIVFCCTPAFGIAALPRAMNQFMLKNAELTDMSFFFEMPEKVVEGVREGIYDLGVIEHCECLDLKELWTQSLPNDEVLFVSSPRLGLDRGLVPVDALTGLPLYTRKEGCCSRKFLEMNMKKIGRESGEFRKMIVYDDLHLILQSVVAGMGIGFMSASVVENYLADGTLREHRVAGFHHGRRRTLLSGAPVNPGTAMADFMECIFAVYQKPTAHAAA